MSEYVLILISKVSTYSVQDNELDEKLSKDMAQIDFNSQDGKDYLDSLTAEILDIWKQE